MIRITRFEVSAFGNDIYLENGEVRLTNPDIKVCLACDVGDLENKTEEIIRHQKYKRCIALKEMCFLYVKFYAALHKGSLGFSYAEMFDRKRNHYEKWYKTLLKISEQYKD